MKQRKSVARFAAATLILGSALAAAAGPALAGENSTRLSVAYYLSSGDYGLSTNTDTEYVPISLDYYRGPWSFNLTVPYVRISGFGTVTMGPSGPIQVSHTPGGGMFGVYGAGFSPMGNSGATTTTTTTTTTTLTKVTESGLGDITAAVGYSFLPAAADGLLIEVNGRVKFPTADENKGLGTGEFDYSAQVDLSKPFGALTPFVTAGYTITGDSDRINYNNVFYSSIGASYSLTDAVSVKASYDYRQKATDDADNAEEASVSLSWLMNDTWSATVSGSTGFTNASPDWSGGLEVAMSF